MGRLSTFAKNRILNLRFQKCFRIKQIALTLQQEDSIKVSRKSISTFLKKYIETKSINDKPRSGRNKKLTPEEINLIGEVTRLNRDITAPKIKEYLNLNVSTYTILRASKLFEWNKFNPNSNQAKKEAAIQRKISDGKRKKSGRSKSAQKATSSSGSSANNSSSEVETINCSNNNLLSSSSSISLNDSDSQEYKQESKIVSPSLRRQRVQQTNSNTSLHYDSNNNQIDPNLNLIPEEEILMAKNVSSSPMVFTTRMLYRVFRLDELLGHNVSGKTFNKFIKNKKALDETRVNYIRWLVESHFEAESKEDLWKACRTAINKSIRNNEIKAAQLQLQQQQSETSEIKSEHVNMAILSRMESEIANQINQQNIGGSSAVVNNTLINLQPTMTIVQITNDLPLQPDYSDVSNNNNNNNNATNGAQNPPIVIRLTDEPQPSVEDLETKTYIDLSKQNYVQDMDLVDETLGLNSLSEAELMDLRNFCCSPMIFSTRLLLKIFTKEELIGHNVSSKTYAKSFKNKQPLDESRINYIRQMVEKYYMTGGQSMKHMEDTWMSCRKAINRVIRNFEVKESKLIKSLDEENENENEDLLYRKSVATAGGQYKIMVLNDEHEMDSNNSNPASSLSNH